MMYKVIVAFRDLQTDKHYKVGDVFPAESVSAKRLEELASGKNKAGKALIQKVEEPVEAEPIEETPEEKPKKATKRKSAKK